MPAQAPILVVDDDPANLELVEGRLTAEGLTCVTAATATEALALVEAAEFSGVLLDLRLPDASELEVLAAIKTRKPALPVLIMTAHGSAALASEALAKGAAGYLLKPISRPQLIEALKAAIARPAV